jgi:peptidyl-prolyl isomerase E (cyclophilin E)
MEDGPASKKTIFVANLNQDIDQTTLLGVFSTFGDVINIQLPLAPNNKSSAGIHWVSTSK